MDSVSSSILTTSPTSSPLVNWGTVASPGEEPCQA